jgi:thioredoxin 1
MGAIMATVISSADFEKLVLQADKPVLVDFFATWCGPCRMVAPVLEEIAAEKEGNAYVYKVDIDASPDIAQKYGIMSVPTMVVFEGGAIKAHAIGARPKADILALLA